MKVDEKMLYGAKDERWERESSPNEWGIESSIILACLEEMPRGKVEGFHGALTSDKVMGGPKKTD